MNLESSYAAASVFPAKLLRRQQEFFAGGRLYPYHVQISLTNKCNLDCGFCSCSDRDKGMELHIEKAKSIMYQFQLWGAQSLTITGGGEPMLHPQFGEFVDFVKKLGISMGLVTNGMAFDHIDSSVLSNLVWCRVSVSDESDLAVLLPKVEKAVVSEPVVDWAYSYVGTADLDQGKAMEVVEHANKLGMKHVRLVTDILDEGIPLLMSRLKGSVKEAGIDDSRVIYQDRKTYTRGVKRCLISLVKPIVGTDGEIYPCCGVQYARENLSRDFDVEMSMGADIPEIWQEQIPFDGSKCGKCYYSAYNEVLGIMVDQLDHEEFI